MDKAGLTTVLGADAARLVDSFRLRSAAPSKLDALKAPAGIRRIQVGTSTDGKPIWAYVWGDTDPLAARVLVYGFPHPDEPLGAAICMHLIEHASDPALAGVAWMVIPCADPDIASLVEDFSQLPDAARMADYVFGSVRLTRLAREVDYGFPIVGSTFAMPRSLDNARSCKSHGRCMQPEICGDICQRLKVIAGPLPESLALADAINLFQPSLVCGMHNAAASGIFDFHTHEPTAIHKDLRLQLLTALGQPRHLGVVIDPGRAWDNRQPDLRREPRLEDAERRFRARHDIADTDTRRWLRHGSCAQYLAWRRPQAQYLVPEAGAFTHEDFADTQVHEELIDLTLSNDGRWLMHITWPGETTASLVPWRYAREGDPPSGPQPLSYGMSGVLAIALRRRLLASAQLLHQMLAEAAADLKHPLAAELGTLTGPPSVAWLQNERWLKARSARNDRLITKAQHADFAWRWAVESCALAARTWQLARVLDMQHLLQARQLHAMITDTLDTLPLRDNRLGGAQSQYARLLLEMQQLDSSVIA